MRIGPARTYGSLTGVYRVLLGGRGYDDGKVLI
jgi:hypothetical protein